MATGQQICSIIGLCQTIGKSQLYVNFYDSDNFKSIGIDVKLHPNGPKRYGFRLKRSIAGDTTLVRVTTGSGEPTGSSVVVPVGGNSQRRADHLS